LRASLGQRGALLRVRFTEGLGIRRDMLTYLSDVVMNTALEVTGKNGLCSCLCKRSLWTCKGDLDCHSGWIADSQDQWQLWCTFVSFIGEADPHCQRAWKRLPVGEYLLQDGDAKRLSFTGIDLTLK
jgi:hypothetical protein